VSPDLSGFSLWALFRGELDTHAAALNKGLLALEQDPSALDTVKPLMRAAHSIKGAARVVQHALAVEVAHAMEDRLVAAQDGARPLTPDDLQRLLEAVDVLERISPENEAERDARVAAARADATALVATLRQPPAAGSPALRTSPPPPAAPPVPATPAPVTVPPAASSAAPESAPAPAPQAPPATAADRSIRLTAQTVTRLVGLVSDAVVSTRWLEPVPGRLLQLKAQLTDLGRTIDQLEIDLEALGLPEQARDTINDAQLRIDRARVALNEQVSALEGFSIRQEALADKLYREVVATRMRPFAEVTEAMPRLVRDLARQLDKKVRLEIEGRTTEVDRDVAALLDAPLIHLVRNAVDHGIEAPADRARSGKPETGTIRLAAWHRAGMLQLTVADDGRGVDVERIRSAIVERGLTDAATAARLSEEEILTFLFLPGFSTAGRVTEVSGRGVGLDVVQDALKAVGGRVTIGNSPGRGLTFTFALPLTLSVMRVLLVEVAREPYALPLTKVERVSVRRRNEIALVEGRAFLPLRLDDVAASQRTDAGAGSANVGLVSARQVLDLGPEPPPADDVAVVILRGTSGVYGLAVDRLLGEEVIVVRPLDPRLGKVKDVSSAGLLGDGSPVVVLDVDDVVRSIEQLLETGRLARVGAGSAVTAARKRVLVVDDSITVREIERQVLEARGYLVDVAVDGVDGWNALRTGRYDLVVTDVDMPRLDGIELVRRVRVDPRYATLPIVIVSYKDRDEDRLRGLDAGASYYLPKSSFQDDRLLRAVEELIGGPEGT
jgi:two-component system sensor histidine kinase and response regulator WspE